MRGSNEAGQLLWHVQPQPTTCSRHIYIIPVCRERTHHPFTKDMSTEPFLLTAYSPKEFSKAALHKGFSHNALKPVSKIELLKDTRIKDHWCHEFLVFTVAHEGRELHLYFERELDDSDDGEGLKAIAVFAWRFFSGKAYDNLEFHEAGCEADVEKKAWTKPSECPSWLPGIAITHEAKQFSKSNSDHLRSHSRISPKSWMMSLTRRNTQNMDYSLQIVGLGPAAFYSTSSAIQMLPH